MFSKKNLEASLDGVEIGATGRNRLQCVFRAGPRNVTLKLSASEARFLASALEHWAADSETIPSASSELLHKVLADYLGGKIDTSLFCSNFEQAFNFDVDRNELTAAESASFERLFGELVYFSPFAEERATIPNYRGEEQIRQAARTAEAELRTIS